MDANAYEIPTWIKGNAEWWAQDKIDDATFVSGIQFLVKEGIIQIPETSQTSEQNSQETPGWVKNNAGWWAQGLISDDDFIKGIEHLVKVGIVNVASSNSNEVVTQSNLDFNSPGLETYENEDLKMSLAIPEGWNEWKRGTQIRLVPDESYKETNPEGLISIVLNNMPTVDNSIDEQIELVNNRKDQEAYKTMLGKYEAYEVFGVVQNMPMIVVAAPHGAVTNGVAFFFYDNDENRQLIEEIKKSYQYIE